MEFQAQCASDFWRKELWPSALIVCSRGYWCGFTLTLSLFLGGQPLLDDIYCCIKSASHSQHYFFFLEASLCKKKKLLANSSYISVILMIPALKIFLKWTYRQSVGHLFPCKHWRRIFGEVNFWNPNWIHTQKLPQYLRKCASLLEIHWRQQIL